MSKPEVAGAQTRPSYTRALLWYRIMAYTTGVVLTVATVMLILQKVVDVHGIDTPTGLLWFFHGYLFLVYAAVTLYLGLKLGWSLIRIALTAACGTIPLMSFVAERYVHRHVQADLARRGR
jgi:integral membrane protein